MSTLFHVRSHPGPLLVVGFLGLLAAAVVLLFPYESTPVRHKVPTGARTIGLRFRNGVNDVVLSYEQLRALNQWDSRRTASNPPSPKAVAPSP
jgi:hypothetical protein